MNLEGHAPSCLKNQSGHGASPLPAIRNSQLAAAEFILIAMADALTPMMQQYQRLRGSVPADTLLLFRLGDFYELFFEDAKEAAGLLNVALTKRNGVPMCGVPYHAAQNYIAKLIKAGKRVAICDQTSEPQPGRIVTRDITQIISAGTVSELDLLEAKRANYLGAIYHDRQRSDDFRFRLRRFDDRRISADAIERRKRADG